ncbi:hypothetical protein K443DRAFT_686481 [Laccaria amethystina LaAM-08-1]|uniref:Uncharacterized protein n=1 Tax=Laccaria amethystina LaAM-08-1 TaxID=1095629 RepID=A0A0C9X2L4_9AGAR|nr:hypothetical protein K443DRAFT_686481 [Laccaria amethystina LaAM-08-1]
MGPVKVHNAQNTRPFQIKAGQRVVFDEMDQHGRDISRMDQKSTKVIKVNKSAL